MRNIFLLPLLFLLNACATVKVDVDYDGQADFTHLYRYAWLDGQPPVSGDNVVDSNTLLHDRIRVGIDQWFTTHGYLKSETGEADFLVIYRFVIENKTRVTVLHPYYDYPYSWRFGYHHRYYYSSFAWHYYPERYAYEYQRGTLVIDLVDPKTKKLMWRGMAYENIRPNTSPDKKQQYVTRAIKSILSRFPPLTG